MFKAFVLVRNLWSGADSLDFGEFRINLIGLRFEELKEVFSSTDVNQDDWVLEKSYTHLPPGPPGSPVGGIPTDTEDILFLLRLFRSGDISFVRQAIVQPNGRNLVQFPYRAMNDVNSYSALRLEIEPKECAEWKAFADDTRASQSWTSEWFAAARRFFLCGGAKEFNPRWDDVDRILDYATALEATLVPEKDYNTRRIRYRAAALIARDDPHERERIAKLLNQFYEIRSRLVHGSGLDADNREWLFENCKHLELRVRQILNAAVRHLPPAIDDRKTFLAGLYDPTDKDRADFVIQKFREIKTPEVRRDVAARIVELV